MVETVKNILNSVIPILFILATVIFLWGIVRFLTAAGDPNKVKEGRSLMLWGIVALAVMSSVWGLAKVLTETFKIQPGSIPGVPGTTPGTPPPGTPPPGYL